MMFDLSKVELSYRDLPAGVKLPTEPSPELAEFIGILAGDGYVARYGKGNNNLISIAGHMRDDRMYLNYVNNLIELLFGIKFKLRIQENITTIDLYRRSQGISQFLTAIGYEKIHCIMKIPDWIWVNEKYSIAFIRGFFDTDGSLCLKNNHGKYKFYPVVDITSKDKHMIELIARWATKYEIRNNVLDDSYVDKRTNKRYTKFKLQISGCKNTLKWTDIIGSSNPTKQRRINLVEEMVGRKGFEPLTLRSSAVCSPSLSYRPIEEKVKTAL